MKRAITNYRLWIGIHFVSLVLSSSVYSQASDYSPLHRRFEVGVRLMPTISAMDLRTSEGGTTRGSANVGFGASGFAAFYFNNHFGLQAEFIYSNLTQKFSETDTDHKIILKYINVPLLLSFNTGISKMINLNLVAGPQIGISAGAKLETTNVTSDIQPKPVVAVRNGDFGVAYGAGVDFGLNSARTFRLGVGYRGVLGLVDISDDNKSVIGNNFYVLDRSKVRTNAVYLGLSFRF